MVRETIHKAYRAFTYGTMINFLLFGLIALSIGGDALNGKVEEGQYYLGNHGRYTEVNCITFLYSKLHALSVFVTFPFLIPASIVYWLTGGNEPPSSTITSAIKQPPGSLIPYINYAINSFLWKASDLVEGIFWGLLDSWRRPSIEFFAKLPRKECMAKLFEALILETSTSHSKRAIVGYVSGTHFSLFKQPRSGKHTPVTLFGKFTSTPEGTYVRAWHRLPAIAIMLFSLGLSIPLGFFTYALMVSVLIPAIVPVQIKWPSWPVRVFFVLFVVGLTLLFVWGSSSVGSKRNARLVRFLEHTLKQSAC